MTSSYLPSVDSIQQSLNEVCFDDDHQYYWENHRRFSGYGKRLQHIMKLLLRSYPSETLPASVQTPLKGIAVDLAKAVETLSVYANKGKIYVLINCVSLCTALHERTLAIGGWLALLHSALEDFPDLHKKVADLSIDMKQTQLRVTGNEERVHCTLQKEGQGRQSSKVIQSAIIMDLARALGIDLNNHSELSEQVKHLKEDLTISSTVSERRILTSLERILDNWSIQPDIFLTPHSDLDFEDNAQILPFSSFLCPLTKEVMKDPVVLESSQNYERIAIQYWFNRCIEDGRYPTCPVTGQVLQSLELKPNIGLAGAIEEWVNRNIEIHVNSAMKYLNENPPSVDSIEHVLDTIHKISEEHPASRYKVRNAGIVVLVVNVLRNSSKKIGSHLRSKALMTLLSMAKDVESKEIMLQEGITRLSIHGLIGSSEKEREYAVKLLLEFSRDDKLCVTIASQKGALVLLSSMAGNLERPALSNLAEEVLKLMEKVEDNVQHLATAGRFEPLLTRLCEGTDDVKIEMAHMLGRMTLTNISKEQIARRSAKILIELLSNAQGRTPSLQALYNLSSLDENATILVDSAALPALLEILFENVNVSSESTELAASIIANILSKPGQWELASGCSDEKHSVQSESVVFGLIGLLSVASAQCQVSILRILYGTASSPLASESVTAHIKSTDGLKAVTAFLDHPEIENRIYAFKLARVLSEKLCDDLANELKSQNKLLLIKEKILDNHSTDGERSDAACILASLSLSENEVKTLLDATFVKWTISTLRSQHHSSTGRTIRPTSIMVEGLLGLLLHLARSLCPESFTIIEDYALMAIFREQLVLTFRPKERELAAIGLRHLSESKPLRSVPDTPPPRGFCSSFIFACGQARPGTATAMCPFHNFPCKDDSQFCLLKGNCVKPLLDLLTDDNTGVQIAVVEALSTLVINTSNGFDRAVNELDRTGVVEGVITLFIQSRPGQLQEKLLWMVERLLKAESLVLRHSLNQPLVRALVDAFKHGSSLTKRHAQDALTSLKQISGVSGKTSSQNRGQR